MKAADIAQYLDTNCPLLKFVGVSADFASAEKVLRSKLPAAFVIPLAETASPNNAATMVVSQAVVQQFGIVIATSNVRDATGGKALDDLYAVRSEIFSKLLGWIPSAQKTGFEFAGGNLHDMSDQVVWWQDNWAITIYLRSA